MRYFHSVDSVLLNNDFKDYLDEFSDFIGESREDGKTITDFFLNDAVHPSELAPFFESHKTYLNLALMNAVIYDINTQLGLNSKSKEWMGIAAIFNYGEYLYDQQGDVNMLLDHAGIAGIYLGFPSGDSDLRKGISKTFYESIKGKELKLFNGIGWTYELESILKTASRHCVLELYSSGKNNNQDILGDNYGKVNNSVKKLCDLNFLNSDPNHQKESLDDVFLEVIKKLDFRSGKKIKNENDCDDEVIRIVISWISESIRARIISGQNLSSFRAGAENVLSHISDILSKSYGGKEPLTEYLCNLMPSIKDDVERSPDKSGSDQKAHAIEFILMSAIFPLFEDYSKEFLTKLKPRYDHKTNSPIESGSGYLNDLMKLSMLDIGLDFSPFISISRAFLENLLKYNDISNADLAESFLESDVGMDILLHLFRETDDEVRKCSKEILEHYILRLPDTWHTPKYEWLLEVRQEVIEENDIQMKRLFNRSVIETISNDEYETDSLALQEMYDRAGGFENTRLEFILDDESLRDDILNDLLKASSRISPVIIDMAKINHDDYRAKWDKVSQHLKKAIIANELSI